MTGLGLVWEPPCRADGLRPAVLFRPALRLAGLVEYRGRLAFDGGAYAPLVEIVARVDLRRERVPSRDVRLVAAALGQLADARPPCCAVDGLLVIERETDRGVERAEISVEEILDLRRMFAGFGAAGWSLSGWW